MKVWAAMVGLSISLFSTMTIAQEPVLTGRDSTLTAWAGAQVGAGNESSTNLVPVAGVNQNKPAMITSQAGDTSQDGNTLRLVLLALLVMGSIALRRSGSAR